MACLVGFLWILGLLIVMKMKIALAKQDKLVALGLFKKKECENSYSTCGGS